MATTNMPKKNVTAEGTPTSSQKRPPLERFRLQVDHQTKASFPSFQDAEKIGKSIKKTYPVVQVVIYDSKDGQQTIL
jgi:hypothetical protein